MIKSDPQLLADVAEELKYDPSLDSSKIKIGVNDGIVTLTGTVPSYWQKVEAEIKAALDHVSKSADKRKAWEDVHWALINAKEFLFRH